MDLPFQDQFVTLTNVLGSTFRTRYWDVGEGEVVLFLHGIGDSLEMCLSTIDAFKDDYRFVAVDIPGHGKSELVVNREVYTSRGFTAFIRAFIEQAQIPTPVNVFAHSLGGTLGTRMAFTHPDLVRRVVLVGPAGYSHIVAFKFRLAALPVLGSLYFSKVILKRVKQSALAEFPDNEYPSLDYIHIKYNQQQAQAKHAVLNLLHNEIHFSKGFTHAFTQQELDQLTAPVLVFWGEQDTTVPANQYQDAMQGLPDNRVVLFENAGHRPLVSRADIVNRLSREFFENGYLSSEIESQQPYRLP